MNGNSEEITAIVPVWNRRELVPVVLATLRAQTASLSEILVIDNGSVDGAAEEAEARGARVIRMGRNTGFACAVNRGICGSHSAWIAVVNNDVELSPNYFERLQQAALENSAWFATGKLFMAGQSKLIDGTFDVLCRGGVPWRAGHARVDGPEFSQRRTIFAAPWTAVLFRAGLFDEIGLLDERFESYLEDVEFGVRCAKAALAGRYVPEAVAWHRGSATLGTWHSETVRRIARNQLLLLSLHYPRSLLVRNAWHIFVAHMLWGMLAIRHSAGAAWLAGRREGLELFEASRGIFSDDTATVLARWLHTNEREIRIAQGRSGYDAFWRMYHLLTSNGAK